MGAVGREELFAGLCGEGRVVGGQNDISNRNLASPLVFLDVRWEVVVLDMSGAVPWGKEAHFTEIAIIGKVKFGSEAQDLAVQDNGAGIVSAISVENGQTKKKC